MPSWNNVYKTESLCGINHCNLVAVIYYWGTNIAVFGPPKIAEHFRLNRSASEIECRRLEDLPYPIYPPDEDDPGAWFKIVDTNRQIFGLGGPGKIIMVDGYPPKPISEGDEYG